MTLLSLRHVSHAYQPGSPVLEDVNLDLRQGENLGILGESGSGKTTLMRVMLGLVTPQAGVVEAEGSLLDTRSAARMRAHRRMVQPVFQDPYTSLDPRMRVGRILAEPVQALALPFDARAESLRVLAAVGLPPDSLERFPRAFSGGQRQRIAIARALIARPKVLLADEPVSALDLSTRVRIVDLLRDLSRETTMALVSHDIAIVAALCPRMMVLQRGRVVEAGPVVRLLAHPKADCTRALVAAMPVLAS